MEPKSFSVHIENAAWFYELNLKNIKWEQVLLTVTESEKRRKWPAALNLDIIKYLYDIIVFYSRIPCETILFHYAIYST